MSFRYKPEIESKRPRGFGLIAEDVESIRPDLVTRDGDGKGSSVRYDAANAMLLNECLKDHRKVQDQKRRIQEQAAMIAQLKRELETLVACVEEHESKIQRVNDRIEMNEAAPQFVAGDQRGEGFSGARRGEARTPFFR